jgi:hypothetical protein
LYITGRQEYTARQLPPLSNLDKLMSFINPLESETKTKGQRLTDVLGAFGGAKFIPLDLPQAIDSSKTKFGNVLKEEVKKLSILGEDIPYQDEMRMALRELFLEDADKKTNFSGVQELDTFLGYTGSSAEMDYLIKKLKEPYYEKKAKITDADLTKLVAALKEEGITPKLADIQNVLDRIKPGWREK